MIEALFLVLLGVVGTLYLTNSGFRDKVNDLCSHVGNLFRSKPADPPGSADPPVNPK